MKITIIGGTGRVGRRVADNLRAFGNDVLAVSPSRGVDAVTGEGLAQAMEGASAVVNLIEARTFEPDGLKRSLQTASRNISECAQDAGIEHSVLLSVVGTPLLQESPYFQAKLLQEEALSAGNVPFTIIRATQFFEFLGSVADMNDTGGTIEVPDALIRPVAVDDVATVIAKRVTDGASGSVVELGGPDTGSLQDFVARWLVLRDDRRRVMVSDEAKFAGARIGKRTLLCGEGATLLPTTWQEWAAAEFPEVARPTNATG